MIGRLSGVLAWRGSDRVLVDVRGVGYEVFVSEGIRMRLPGLGEAVTLWTEMIVREDLLQLFGFLTLEDREWHRLLTTVQGVGAKSAAAIVGVLGASGTARAVSIGDWAAIKAAPGVGPKLAQRVVLELKDKAHVIMAMGASTIDNDDVIEPIPAPKPQPKPAGSANTQAEALSALTNLGYGPSEAAQAVAQANAEGADGTQAMIRAALKLLAPKAT